MNVFCSRSIQVAKNYRTLAYQLHEGKQVCTSKLILGCLYESLNQGATDIRDQVNSLIIPSPMWLFQLWLFATFGSELGAFLSRDFEEAYKDMSAEGIGFSMLRYNENKTSQALFSEAFNVFLSCNVFTPCLAPFLTRTCGL